MKQDQLGLMWPHHRSKANRIFWAGNNHQVSMLAGPERERLKIRVWSGTNWPKQWALGSLSSTKMFIFLSLLLVASAQCKIYRVGNLSNGLVHHLSVNNNRLLPAPPSVSAAGRGQPAYHKSRVTWISGSDGLNGRPTRNYLIIL